MKTSLLTGFVAVTLLFSAGLSAPCANDNANAHAEHESLFNVLVDSNDYAIVTSTLRAHDSDAIDKSAYGMIIKGFCIWMHELLDESCLPSDEYVADNIKLFPANGKDRHQDAALVSYTQKGVQYHIIQTGGWEARVWLIVNARNNNTLSGRKYDGSEHRTMIDNYVRHKVREQIYNVKVTTNNAGWMAASGYSKDKPKFNRSRIYGANGIICLSVERESYDVTMPARQPKPDRWFEWWKDDEPANGASPSSTNAVGHGSGKGQSNAGGESGGKGQSGK